MKCLTDVSRHVLGNPKEKVDIGIVEEQEAWATISERKM